MDLQAQMVANCIMTSTNALYIYDSLLTLSQEVDALWRRKWTTTTWIYACIRYSTIVSAIVVFIPGLNFKTCQTIIFLRYGVRLTQWLCFTFFSTLRVYALLAGKTRLLACVVFVLNMVPFAVYIFTFAESSVQVMEDACASVAIGKESANMTLRCALLFHIVSLAVHIAAVVASAIVLSVTWLTTFSLFKETRRLGFRTPLTALLLRDGTTYFLLLLVVNVFQVLTAMLPMLAIWVIADALISLAVPVIVCRFILNLRQFDYSGDSIISGDQTFSLRFVGSLGGPLQTSTDDELADEGYDDEHVAQGMRPRRTDTATVEAGKEGLAGHTD